MQRYVDKIVHERQQQDWSGTQTFDYLSQLLNNTEYNDPISVRDTLVTLLFAGRDNTQNSLAWSMHALLRHPEWATRMRNEACQVQSTANNSYLHDSQIGVCRSFDLIMVH